MVLTIGARWRIAGRPQELAVPAGPTRRTVTVVAARGVQAAALDARRRRAVVFGLLEWSERNLI